MILVVVLLVASPVLYWLISPMGWAYSAALEKQKSGDLAGAENDYLHIVEKNPQHSMAYLRLSELAFGKQDYESALRFAKSALTVAKPQQKPAIINLETNSLTALERKKEAVASVAKLHEFTTLPKEYDQLSREELMPFLSNPANRHFLNSLAYIMAVNGENLSRAESYIDAVVFYFERHAEHVRITAPYLYERASRYREAFDSLQFELAQVRKELDGESTTLIARGPQDSSGNRVVNQLSHYVINNRLRLLADKLENEESQQFAEEMKKYADSVKEPAGRIKIDDVKFLQYAYELQHYLDTRSIIRLGLGDEQTASSIGKRKDNVLEFLELCDEADAYYQSGYRDLVAAISMKSATNAYHEKYPENSLMISLPNDAQAFEREKNRLQAIEHYHSYLLLNSLGRIEEANSHIDEIEKLGHQPGRHLF